MGSPPTGLLAIVERRREHRVTGVCTRTDRRSLETLGPNATGSCQTNRGQVHSAQSMQGRKKYAPGIDNSGKTKGGSFMPDPIPTNDWSSQIQQRNAEVGHVFPPRPEVVQVTQADLARRAVGTVEPDGYCPSNAPLRPTPQLLRPEQERRALWRRAPGQQDDKGEPTTIFPPDTRRVIYDTTFPWRTCGRVAVPGGWGSGVMIGRRHMMTASHVVPWLPGGGSDWLTFTPMQVRHQYAVWFCLRNPRVPLVAGQWCGRNPIQRGCL